MEDSLKIDDSTFGNKVKQILKQKKERSKTIIPSTGAITAAVFTTLEKIKPLLVETTSRAPSGELVPIPTCAMVLNDVSTAIRNIFLIFIIRKGFRFVVVKKLKYKFNKIIQ